MSIQEKIHCGCVGLENLAGAVESNGRLRSDHQRQGNLGCSSVGEYNLMCRAASFLTPFLIIFHSLIALLFWLDGTITFNKSTEHV